jgi:hypothetical protein
MGQWREMALLVKENLGQKVQFRFLREIVRKSQNKETLVVVKQN